MPDSARTTQRSIGRSSGGSKRRESAPGLLRSPARASRQSSAVPRAAAKLEGVYRGTWTLYRVDERGAPAKSATWRDVLTASDARIENERALVSTVDRITFDDRRTPPMTVRGAEGYFLTRNGAPGRYFVEVKGTTYRARKVDKNTWVYVMTLSPADLVRLGFERPLAGRHTIVKAVTEEDGVETHRITRLSTVNWEDAKGRSRWTQYVSLVGMHRREPARRVHERRRSGSRPSYEKRAKET